jgi:hypothetical protein
LDRPQQRIRAEFKLKGYRLVPHLTNGISLPWLCKDQSTNTADLYEVLLFSVR